MEENHHIIEGFTLTMAILDMIPVLFFSIASFVLAIRFESSLFRLGIGLVILAGCLKALWKFIIALTKRDIHFLSRQMRYLMPLGFLIALISLAVDHQKWSIVLVLHHLLTFPSLLFFVMAIVGMIILFWYGTHFDTHDAKANWKEQMINGIVQLCVMLCILY